MKTRVHITVDTEFSIAGAFSDPENCRPVGPQSVYCRKGETSEGLGFMLELLARYGHRATFFVEALNRCYFGIEPMGEIARRLQGAGHDVQLHLHPCWTYFENADWARQLRTNPPNDDITLRDLDELVRIIRIGQSTFEQWGLPGPTVLRTGGLRANLMVYEAMRRCGMRVASNLGLAVYRPRETALHLYAGCHDVDGVTELPVTTFTDLALGSRKHYKNLTITGCAWSEIRSLLRHSRDAGLTDVVVLTHPFEYIKHRDNTYEQLGRDRINRKRLEHLCDFLATDPGFEAATLGAVPVFQASAANPVFRVSPAQALGRMLMNRLNHSFMRF